MEALQASVFILIGGALFIIGFVIGLYSGYHLEDDATND